MDMTHSIKRMLINGVTYTQAITLCHSVKST